MPAGFRCLRHKIIYSTATSTISRMRVCVCVYCGAFVLEYLQLGDTLACPPKSLAAAVWNCFFCFTITNMWSARETCKMRELRLVSPRDRMWGMAWTHFRYLVARILCVYIGLDVFLITSRYLGFAVALTSVDMQFWNAESSTMLSNFIYTLSRRSGQNCQQLKHTHTDTLWWAKRYLSKTKYICKNVYNCNIVCIIHIVITCGRSASASRLYKTSREVTSFFFNLRFSTEYNIGYTTFTRIAQW